MKKYIIYTAVLAVGLLLGWFLFGGTSNTETEHKHDAAAETNQMWTCSMHPQIMQPESGPSRGWRLPYLRNGFNSCCKQ